MPSFTQALRAAKLKTPLGEDVLLLSTFVVEEELGRPFTIEVDAVSTEADLDFNRALGLECSISYESISGDVRHFSGVLAAAHWVGERDRLYSYRLTLRPWLWLMAHSGDCKIFQNKSVIDVILDTCRDCGFTDFELQVHETYRTLDYCVQYRESHFAFVSRLMETYGIYYYFRHEDGKHTMVLCDGPGSHSDNPDLGETPYNPSVPRHQFRAQCLKHWSKVRSVQTGQQASRAYDFVQPTANMDSHLSEPGGYAHDQMETFEWGDVYKNGETDAHARHFVRARLLAGQSKDQRREAVGEAPSLFPGSLTTLKRLRPEGENKSYLVVKAQHAFGAQNYHSDAGGRATDESYTGRYELQAADRSFKAEQTTPKPTIMGPQTALVVGPDGEEIYCDKYGRIKVQFYWDRVGDNDQNSSCWVRVAQMNWSGSQWGAVMLPRIGMEVVVQFLDGNPDQPLVTGTVYNGRLNTPYDLQEKNTRMTVRSKSVKASGFNELTFEDDAGNENVFMHAQKDMTLRALNNFAQRVDANVVQSFGGNQSLQVYKNVSQQIGGGVLQVIGEPPSTQDKVDNTTAETFNKDAGAGMAEGAAGYAETLGSVVDSGDLKQRISNNWESTVGNDRTATIGHNQQTSVGSNCSLTVGGDYTIDVGGSMSLTVARDITIKVGGKINILVASDASVTTGGSISTKSAGQTGITAGGGFSVIAPSIDLA